MKRREFINWVGLGVLASSLPVAIAACQSPEEGSTASTSTSSEPKLDKSPRADGFAAVGTLAELDSTGAISDKKFIRDSVIVVRNPADPTAVMAVTSMCTHQGCTVEWDKESALLVCPCHKSKFKADGTVDSGPATKPLTQFDAKIDGELVLVQTKA